MVDSITPLIQYKYNSEIFAPSLNSELIVCKMKVSIPLFACFFFEEGFVITDLRLLRTSEYFMPARSREWCRRQRVVNGIALHRLNFTPLLLRVGNGPETARKARARTSLCRIRPRIVGPGLGQDVWVRAWKTAAHFHP